MPNKFSHSFVYYPILHIIIFYLGVFLASIIIDLKVEQFDTQKLHSAHAPKLTNHHKLIVFEEINFTHLIPLSEMKCRHKNYVFRFESCK